MRILITGGTGFIGRHLVQTWLEQHHHVTVLTRKPNWVQERWHGQVDAVSSLSDASGAFDALVNLAGEGIADQPWSTERKQALRDSRVELTQRLASWAHNSRQQFDVVISGSAIGYYGATGDTPVSENNSAGQGFSAELCVDWESAATLFGRTSQRVCVLRTGIVLGHGGGALDKMWLPFSLGLGGALGRGDQYFSWVHLTDCLNAIHYLMRTPALEGAFNITAPNPVTNYVFTKALGRALHRPTIFTVPSVALSMLLSERADLLLDSQRVLPQKLQQSGFEFAFKEIEPALNAIAKMRKQTKTSP